MLVSWDNSNGRLSTYTNMKYWLPPGSTKGNCPKGAGPYSSPDSGLIFHKEVRFGYAGVPNVLDYHVTYNWNESKGYAVMEALTGYLKVGFSQWLTFDRTTSTVSKLALTSGVCTTPCSYQNLPVIAALPNGTSAMAIYAPVTPDGNYGAQTDTGSSYVKWNVVYTGVPVQGTTFDRQLLVPFGNVDEVINGLRVLTGANLSLIPVFRFFGTWNDHFLTLSYSEAASVGSGAYNFEGTAFKVWAAPLDGNMIPLYRCNDVRNTDHFVSKASNCEGKTYEGVYGYVSSIPRTGYVPIMRYYKSSTTDHLITTNPNEGIGLINEGIIGYAPNP